MWGRRVAVAPAKRQHRNRYVWVGVRMWRSEERRTRINQNHPRIRMSRTTERMWNNKRQRYIKAVTNNFNKSVTPNNPQQLTNVGGNNQRCLRSKSEPESANGKVCKCHHRSRPQTDHSWIHRGEGTVTIIQRAMRNGKEPGACTYTGKRKNAVGRGEVRWNVLAEKSAAKQVVRNHSNMVISRANNCRQQRRGANARRRDMCEKCARAQMIRYHLTRQRGGEARGNEGRTFKSNAVNNVRYVVPDPTRDPHRAPAFFAGARRARIRWTDQSAEEPHRWTVHEARRHASNVPPCHLPRHIRIAHTYTNATTPSIHCRLSTLYQQWPHTHVSAILEGNRRYVGGGGGVVKGR